MEATKGRSRPDPGAVFVGDFIAGRWDAIAVAWDSIVVSWEWIAVMWDCLARWRDWLVVSRNPAGFQCASACVLTKQDCARVRWGRLELLLGV